MGGDEIQSLPFASEQASLNFAYMYTGLTVGHVIDRYILARRLHIKAFRLPQLRICVIFLCLTTRCAAVLCRYSAWGVPLAVAGVYIAAPALPMKVE